jgi:hypothetical protein
MKEPTTFKHALGARTSNGHSLSVVAVPGEERGRAAMLVQLNAPAANLTLVRLLCTARWSRAQRLGWSDITGSMEHPTPGSRN